MMAVATNRSCQVLSFPSPVDRSNQQEKQMIKGLNYTIEPINNETFRIKCQIKRNGEPYRKQETFSGTRNKAIRRAEEIVRDLMDEAERIETSGHPSSLTLLKTFGEGVQFYKENDKKWFSNKCHLDRVEREFKDTPIDQVQEACKSFLKLLEDTFTSRGDVYSPHTLNRYIERVCRVVNFCKEEKQIPPNTQCSIKKYPVEPRDIDISEEDITALFASIREHRPYLLPIAEFAVKVPSRLGELLKLEKGSVSPNDETVRIKAKNSKNRKGVTKPIPPNLHGYFSNEIPDNIKSAFFRVDRNGDTVPLKRFTKAWRYCVEMSGIGKDIRFHDLRHYSSTRMVNSGIPERQIMDIAGWKTPMLSTYFHKDSIEASKNAVRLMKEGKL